MVHESSPREGHNEIDSDVEAVSPGAAETGATSIVHLQEEIAKWRARVPKLAAALAERTERVNQLEAELAAASRGESATTEGGAGARARDERIRELDSKLDQARGELRGAQGALHERSLRVSELEGELAEWQTKWQSVTKELDNGDSAAARSAANLEDANTEIASLKKRADDLIATAEMAHNEVDVLSADLRGLRCDLGRAGDEKKALEEQLVQASARADQAEQEASGVLADAQARFDALSLEHDAQAKKIADVEQALADRDAQLSESREQLASVEQELVDAQVSIETMGNAGEQKLKTLQERFDQQDLELTEALSLAESARSDTQSLTAELDTLRAQADVMTASQQALQSQVDDHNEQLRTSERELTAAREGASVARAEAESARVQLDDARQSKRKAEAAAEEAAKGDSGVRQELEEARGLFEQAVVDLASLRSELSTAQANMQSLIAERDDAAASKIDVEAALHALRDSEAKATTTVQENAEQREALQAKLEQRQQDLEAARNELIKAEDVRDALEQARSELSDRLAAKDAESAEQNAPLESAELAQLREALANKESDIQEQSARHRDELDRSQRGIASIEAERDQLTTQLSEQAHAHDAIQSELLAELSQASAANSNAASSEQVATSVDDEQVQVLESSLNELRKEFDQYKLKSIAQIDIQDKTLIVLNQQLVDSQAENDRLRTALSEAKRSVEEPNLTEIKGIGAKLAKQLNEVGVTSVVQLAELSDNVIDDDHALAPFRSRAIRDSWFEQARALSDRGPVIN